MVLTHLDSSSEDSITQFAEHFKLQNTLQYLSGGASVGDLPVQLPKVVTTIAIRIAS